MTARSTLRVALLVLATSLAGLLGAIALPASPAAAEAPPANDEITDATPITALPYTATQDNLHATQNPADPTPTCGAPHANTVWFTYTPTTNATIQITTTGGDLFPPTPTAYTGPTGATPTTPLTELACSTYLPLQVHVTAGTTYYFMLASATPRPSFTATVAIAVPFTPPAITAPPVTVGTDPGRCGASVSYPDLTVAGNPTPTVSASPPSGSFFGVGTSPVDVSAFNTFGFTSATFTVTVNDTEAPGLTAPGRISVDATGPAGAIVNDVPFAATDNCPGVTSTSTPPSGSTFPIGDTVVTGVATDQAGNHTTATFVVHVAGAAEQLAGLATAAEGVGRGTSLKASLHAAQLQLAHGHTVGACLAIHVFIVQVAVQTPRVIAPAVAQELTTDAQRILSVLGCC